MAAGAGVLQKRKHSLISRFSSAGCLEIDPLSADKAQLREVAAKLDLSNVADTEEDRDTLLQLLFTFGVEPQIGKRPADVCISLPGKPGFAGADQHRRSPRGGAF